MKNKNSSGSKPAALVLSKQTLKAFRVATGIQTGTRFTGGSNNSCTGPMGMHCVTQ